MDTQNVSDLLYSISRGFIQSPERRLLFIVLLSAFILLIALVYFLQERKSRTRHMRNADEVFEHLMRQLGLSRSERVLVNRLAGCCKPPG